MEIIAFSPLPARYDDMIGNVQAAAGVSSLTIEAYRDTPFLMPFFRHDQDDSLYFTFQFSHRKKLGGVVKSVHIHCVPMVNPAVAQDVYFGYSYSWQIMEGAFPALGSWVSGNSTFQVGVADAFKHKYHQIVADIAAPANETHSSVLLFRLTRLGTDPLDTYSTNKAVPPGTAAANLGLLYVDCHYLADRRGSVAELSD